jgi:hypothetical protein
MVTYVKDLSMTDAQGCHCSFNLVLRQEITSGMSVSDEQTDDVLVYHIPH